MDESQEDYEARLQRLAEEGMAKLQEVGMSPLGMEAAAVAELVKTYEEVGLSTGAALYLTAAIVTGNAGPPPRA